MTNPSTAQDARALILASAAAHGSAALADIADISVGYAGAFRSLVGRLQPDLVDAGHRGRSQERILLRDRIVAEADTGPAGVKQVLRRMAAGGEGDVRVWFDGVETPDPDKRAAAALVADGYSLFLLGPMLLAGRWASDRALTMELAGTEQITVFGQPYDCDVVRMRIAPGIGLTPSDQLALFIGRTDHLMRRVRFTLDGLDSTRGAIAEVDTADHVALGGVRWPTRFHERLLRPIPLAVHDWRLEGLDLNRGMTPAELTGPAFTGRAAAPAASLPGVTPPAVLPGPASAPATRSSP